MWVAVSSNFTILLNLLMLVSRIVISKITKYVISLKFSLLTSIAKSLITTAECLKVDLTLNNNIFDGNHGFDKGTILSASHLKENFNNFQASNNTFTNNSCSKDGGIFYFNSAYINMKANNNTYLQNSAGDSGGVGYVTGTDLLCLESNSLYSGNQKKDLVEY